MFLSHALKLRVCALGEECRLEAFENWKRRKIFHESTVNRIMTNFIIFTPCRTLYWRRMMKMSCVGNVETTSEMRNTQELPVRMSESNTLLGRRKGDIKMGVKLGWDVLNWIQMGEGWTQWRAFVNTVTNLRVLQTVRNCLSYRTSVRNEFIELVL